MTPTNLPAAAAGPLAACAPITAVFAAAGHRLFLVGGLVRDLYAGVAHDELDLDLTTPATPTEVKAVLGPVVDALWTQGERFGTIAAKLDGRLVEVTTHRAEAYDPESRKPTVAFSDDILVDLSRRDFTVNAMAIELTAPVPMLIDPYGGLDDLRDGVLRTPLAPVESFSDDPLRMLRAARFTARLGLVPDDALVRAVADMRHRLGVVSVERVRDELDKLLAVPSPAAGLALLLTTGLSEEFLPELTAGGSVERDAGERISAAMVLRPDPVLRLAGLLADAGAAAATTRARALKHSRQAVVRVRSLVHLVDMLRDHGPNWTGGELRRIALAAGDDLGDMVPLLVAGGIDPIAGGTLADGLDRLAASEDLTDLRPALDGAEVMAHLDLSPGRDVGDAIEHLTQIRLEEGPIGAAAERRRLEDWWAARREPERS